MKKSVLRAAFAALMASFVFGDIGWIWGAEHRDARFFMVVCTIFGASMISLWSEIKD